MIRPILAIDSPYIRPQLTYALHVNPEPVTITPLIASPLEDWSPADLVLSITNNSGSTFTLGPNGIQVSLPIGASDGSLSEEWTTVAFALVGSPQSPQGPGFTVLTPDAPAPGGSGDAVWTIIPQTGDTLEAGESFTLQLSGLQVNTQPGTALVTVTENTASPVAFPVTKLEYGFFFNGLVATLNDEPVAQVPYGTPVTLYWNCSVVDVTAITVYWSAPGSPGGSASPTSYGSFLTPALTTDTVFTVVATIPTGNATDPSYQYALSTSVAVNPADFDGNDVTAQTLEVSGNTTLNTVTLQTLTVEASATLNNATLNNATLNNATLSNATLDSPTVSGTIPDLNVTTLDVTNQSVAGSLSGLSGAAVNLAAGATLAGPLSMMQPPVPLQLPPFSAGTSTYTATTDGLFVGFIGDGAAAFAWGALTVVCTPSGGASYEGTVSGALSTTPASVGARQQSCLVLPIPNGSTFAIQFWGGALNQPYCTAYFFPFGVGTATLNPS